MMMNDNEQVSSSFKDIVHKKAEILKQKYSEEFLNKIKLSTVLKMSHFISDLESNPNVENHKENILNYLNEFIYTSKKYSEREILLFRKEHLSPVVYFLNDYDFYTKGTLGFVGILMGLTIDVILFFIGIAKYYSYVPIFTLIFFIQKVRKYYRLKKEGKILDL